jgi:hypothetical protein
MLFLHYLDDIWEPPAHVLAFLKDPEVAILEADEGDQEANELDRKLQVQFDNNLYLLPS